MTGGVLSAVGTLCLTLYVPRRRAGSRRSDRTVPGATPRQRTVSPAPA